MTADTTRSTSTPPPSSAVDESSGLKAAGIRSRDAFAETHVWFYCDDALPYRAMLERFRWINEILESIDTTDHVQSAFARNINRQDGVR